MDSKHIEHLLEKYWACETSLEEEATIKDYFKQEQIPEHLLAHAPLFKYLDEEGSEDVLDAQFDQGVLEAIGEDKQGKQVYVKTWYKSYMKVAAVLLVMVSASFLLTKYLNKQNETAVLADTFDNPEDAFEETKRALLLISKNIGKGRTQTQKIVNFHQAEEKIKNHNNEL
jgi:hypothetical protein